MNYFCAEGYFYSKDIRQKSRELRKLIVFISRSFSDEFIKYLKTANIKWQLKNANSNVKAMIEAVKQTQEYDKNDYDYVAITHFKNKTDLNGFLATI